MPESGNESYAVFLQAVTLPDDKSVTLDFLSTAVTMTMTGIPIREQVDLTYMGEARTRIGEITEVINLSSVLENTLKLEPYFFKDPLNSVYSSDFYNSLFTACEAAYELIDGLLKDGVLQGINNSSRSARKSLEPEITPEQNSIKVFRVGDSGNVGVENDSQLYLSAKFLDSATGAVLFEHINGYFDGNMVSPQGLGLLFWASQKKDYNQPSWRNCTVEVVTPGTSDISPDTPLNVWKYLALRTYIDRVILPVINQAVGDIFSPSDITNILVNYVGTAVNTFGTLLSSGDVKRACASVAQAIYEDIVSVPPGPITQAIAKKFGKKLLEETLEKLAKKIGSKLVPGIGQIAAAVEVAGAVNTFTNVGKAIWDFESAPSLLSFEVQWPLEITDVTPDVITNKPESIRITLEGKGFSPIGKGIWPFDYMVYPQIIFTDEGGNVPSETIEKPFDINHEGTAMTVEISSAFRSFAAGPIGIKIIHDDIETESPKKIEISDIEITGLSPDTGKPGDFIWIFGTGFYAPDPDLSQNFVTFQGENGQRLNASLNWVEDSVLSVTIPEQVVTGDVRVEVNGKISNGLTFTVPPNQVIFNFGDNGSDNDDTFALYVDGKAVHSMPAPTRNAGPITLYLTDGQHNVMLRGITAPDDIGTYFISVTGDVLSITGASLTGDDLTGGVEKHYVIAVGSTAGTNRRYTPSVPKGIIWDE